MHKEPRKHIRLDNNRETSFFLVFRKVDAQRNIIILSRDISFAKLMYCP